VVFVPQIDLGYRPFCVWLGFHSISGIDQASIRKQCTRHK